VCELELLRLRLKWLLPYRRLQICRGPGRVCKNARPIPDLQIAFDPLNLRIGTQSPGRLSHHA